VLNNRPDHEAPDQPLQSEIEAAAKQAGLVYEYLTVVPGQFTEAQVAAFDKHLRELPAPILAFCRSGNRCSMLFSAVMARRQSQQYTLSGGGADRRDAATGRAEIGGLAAPQTRGGQLNFTAIDITAHIDFEVGGLAIDTRLAQWRFHFELRD